MYVSDSIYVGVPMQTIGFLEQGFASGFDCDCVLRALVRHIAGAQLHVFVE
jgi:hypothetical protein